MMIDREILKFIDLSMTGRETAAAWLFKLGLPCSIRRAIKRGEWAYWSRLFPDLEWLYRRLRDDQSRRLLVAMLAFRVTQRGTVTLPWRGQGIRWATALAPKGAATLETGFRGLTLHRMRYNEVGYDVELYRPLLRPCTIFDLEQYSDWSSGLSVEPGDCVIDGGGCWADSATYFASKAGPSGRVFSFEFDPLNVDIFRANMGLNPELAKRITLCEKPLWLTSGVRLGFSPDGPATRASNDGVPDQQKYYRETISVDDFRRENGIPRIDFIKLDIEGAEPEALRGAAATIRDCRPKMALCIYHRPEHYYELAQYIDSIAPGYSYSLGQLTDMEWETILYADPNTAVV